MTSLPARFELPTQQNLKTSAALARQRLAALDPLAQARRAGCELLDRAEPGARLRLVTRSVEILLSEGRVVDAESQQPVSELEEALVLHYLVQTGPVPPPGELMTVAEMPDSLCYGEPFRRRAEGPLERTFGSSAAVLVEVGVALGGTPADLGDGSVTLWGLPLVPVTLVLWEGDEEFPARAKVLLRQNVTSLLPTEDAIVLASQVVYAVLGAYRRRQG